MGNSNRVFVTGVGTVNSAANSREQFWGLVHEKNPRLANVDLKSFYPFFAKSFPEYDLLPYLKKKSELRSLGEGQQLTCFAAGKALDDAKLSGNKELLEKTAIIVACSVGERCDEVDQSILDACSTNKNSEFNYNNILSELRPSLFLMQLPNLYAANISIIHGVKGSSLTFMGEESAGVDAIEVGIGKIKSGQEDIVLVGGSFNANQKYLYTYYGAANRLANTYDAENEDKMILGSSASFLVLESEKHAKSRGANLLAEIQIEGRTDYSSNTDKQLFSSQFPLTHSTLESSYIIGDWDLKKIQTDRSFDNYYLCSKELRGSCFEASPFTDVIFGIWALESKQFLSSSESGLIKHEVGDLKKVFIHSTNDAQCASLMSLRGVDNG